MLNNRVEDIHCMLIEDEQYRAFLTANSNQEAVEGSLKNDRIMAAQMIRDQAKKVGDATVAAQPLAAIRKALGVVLRRYGM